MFVQNAITTSAFLQAIESKSFAIVNEYDKSLVLAGNSLNFVDKESYKQRVKI